MCNSEHGPHGPVSPIIQKLSFLLPLTMCTAGSSPPSRKAAPNDRALPGRTRSARPAPACKPSRRLARRKFPALDHQLPRPLDRFLLEVIAEAPVAEHLEKRVVIRVESDVVEIVMLAAGADAFLRVGDARRIPRRLLLPEKNRHELVHPRVREKQVRRIRQKRSRRHDRVLFLAKEIEKGLADLGGGHREITLPEAAHISKWKSRLSPFFDAAALFHFAIERTTMQSPAKKWQPNGSALSRALI